MALEDDVFGARPIKKPVAHEIGSDLSVLSETEIEERIALLESEIERLKASLTGKRASRAAAETVFKR